MLDFWAPVAGGLVVEFCAVEDAAAFWVRCAENDFVDAGEADSGGAHCAGF